MKILDPTLPLEATVNTPNERQVTTTTPKRTPRRPRRQGLLLPTLTTFILLGVWEALAQGGALPKSIPPLTEIFGWVGGQLLLSQFWVSIGHTMAQWAIGITIGVVFGIILGASTATIRPLHQLLKVPIELLRPVPSIVFLPLLILLFGATAKTSIFCIIVTVTWPMLYQTFYGVRSIDPLTKETGKMFGFSRRQLLTWITWPSVLPYLATGLRISASLALIVAVAIQMIGGVPGLGADLAVYSANGVYAGIYGIIIVSGLIGFLVNICLEWSERRLLNWHVSHRMVAE